MKTEQYSHVEICKKALTDNNVFNNFKRIPEFTQILEHTSQHYAEIYLEQMFSDYKEQTDLLDWKKLKENDTIGGASLVNFNGLGNYIKSYDYNFSPSTIYYIYRGLDIINKSFNNKKEINVLEIGGGYGGQCKLLIDICDMLNIKIINYGIIDLEYVSKLQKKYLTSFGYSNVEFHEFENLKDFNVFKKYDTLVSIYALGEFEIDVQNFYIDNIVKYINNYFIIWNSEIINNYFIDDNIVDEVPKTGRYNKIILRNEK